MKKNIITFILITTTLTLSGCIGDTKSVLPTPINTVISATELPVQTTNNPTKDIVGNDKDVHGCIGSAGYSWCEVKQKCLRIWEEPCAASSEVDMEAIKTAVLDQIVVKRGQGANNLIITVQKVEGDYAQGGAKEDGGGGGMWFATKVDGSWKLVWDGNGIITCNDLKPYPNFPSTLIPECYDENTGKMLQR